MAGGDMIKLSAKQLAEYMTATPASQRRLLREWKYPDPNAFPRWMYYKEARGCIARYHRDCRDANWLTEQAARFEIAADERLDHNARSLRRYAEHFGNRKFVVLEKPNLRVSFGDVIVSARPDLHVTERGKEKLVKLDFVVRRVEDEVPKIITQLMLEAAQSFEMPITASGVEYLHVSSGTLVKGRTARIRVMENIEASCENISAIWDSL
jgi:hypothetical protein